MLNIAENCCRLQYFGENNKIINEMAENCWKLLGIGENCQNLRIIQWK